MAVLIEEYIEQDFGGRLRLMNLLGGSEDEVFPSVLSRFVAG